MNKLRIVLSILLIVVLVGCTGGEEEIKMNPLEPIEREAKENEEEFIEVAVEDNSSNGVDDENSTDVKTEESEDVVDEETIEDNVVETEEDSNLSSNETEEQLLQDDEYQVLDSSEVEDLENYETGLVFIVKEDDIWRVVDRLGNVFRVSTSNEAVVQGIVNVKATVTSDDEGNAKVSLSRDYDKYPNNYILQVESNLEEEFSKGLLEKQLSAPADSKIDSYTLNRVSSDKIGKGIRRITMNFSVVPSSGATMWAGNQKDIDYSYTVYGYETTWILPIKAPLYKSLAMTDNQEESNEANNSSETEEISSTGQFKLNELQKLLAEVNNKIYYTEKELLPQTDQLLGTDIYEHVIRIYQYDLSNGNLQQIVKGDKNSNYDLVTVSNNKMYLMLMDQTPSAGGSFIGLAYLELGDLSFRSLYRGQIARGITLDDRAFIFTNDNLVEINLENASLRIASNLPKHLDFDINSVDVLDFSNNILTVEIAYETEAITYTIQVITGETTVIDSFTY